MIQDLFFNDLGTSVGGEEDAAPIPLPEAVDDAIKGTSEEANTIKALQRVVDIDDDNELAPKNVPATADNSNRLLSTEWGHDGFCVQKESEFWKYSGKIKFFCGCDMSWLLCSAFRGVLPQTTVT